MPTLAPFPASGRITPELLAPAIEALAALQPAKTSAITGEGLSPFISSTEPDVAALGREKRTAEALAFAAA